MNSLTPDQQRRRLTIALSMAALAATGLGCQPDGEPATSPLTVYRQPADFASQRPTLPVKRKPYNEWDLRETVVDALSRIGAPAVPELRNRLTSNDAEVRAQAADVLGRIGPDANEAIPELIILLDDESGPVRRSAARALGQIGPAAEQAVPSLMRVLEDETLKKQTRDDNDAE
ncbi:MAG: HEAT repeat domain-containing protein [Pirellulaceae bacterium]|jgi:hypothetical protein|nr:HEAT repeat domain-containing protein [Pirellulaceae bacterium]